MSYINKADILTNNFIYAGHFYLPLLDKFIIFLAQMRQEMCYSLYKNLHWYVNFLIMFVFFSLLCFLQNQGTKFMWLYFSGTHWYHFIVHYLISCFNCARAQNLDNVVFLKLLIIDPYLYF